MARPREQAQLRRFDPALAALDRNQEGLRRRKTLGRGQTYLTPDDSSRGRGNPPLRNPTPPATPFCSCGGPADCECGYEAVDVESESAPFPREGEPTL